MNVHDIHRARVRAIDGLRAFHRTCRPRVACRHEGTATDDGRECAAMPVGVSAYICARNACTSTMYHTCTKY